MKVRFILSTVFCTLVHLTYAQLSLTPFIPNVFKVTDITNCGDERLFIAEQAGRIRISDLNGNMNAVPFLSITDRVNDSGGEQGLLGLAFSPKYITDKRFYVNYTNNSGNTVISRFTATADPAIADSMNEEILFVVQQPFSNHNGGAMHFGPDGFLYLSLGDGGSGGDPANNAQTLNQRLGKLLRINVDVLSGYAIPNSNPFIGVANADSMVWSYGLRNAWRFAFDALTGDKWIADVGQNLWEEINFQPAASSGGENYGWRCYEAYSPYDLSLCQPLSFVEPIYAYPHFPACSVTGGYVYRGAKYASWFGKYFFTDYCSGEIQSLTPNDTGGYDHISYGLFGAYAFSTFGVDKYGELYIGKATSGVFKMNDSTCTPVSYITEKDTIIYQGTSMVLQTPYFPGFYYQWYLNDVLLPYTTGNTLVVTVSGHYKVKVVGQNLCTSISKSVFVLLDEPGEPVIFPNPAGDYAELSWSANLPGEKTIEIFDARGRLCEKVSPSASATSYTIDTYKYNKGVYVIRILHQDNEYNLKLVVK